MRLCQCHGAPMVFKPDKRYITAGGYWVCSIKRRELLRSANQRLRERRAANGLCTRCGRPDPIGATCWRCLNQVEANHALSQ